MSRERDQTTALYQAFQGVATALLELGVPAEDVQTLAAHGVDAAVRIRGDRERAREASKRRAAA